MGKSPRDIFSDVFIVVARPIINILMRKELKVTHSGLVIKKKQEPFILVSNHFNTWDSFVVMKNVKTKIRFVATEMAFLDWSKKIGMQHLARAIKKRVGKSDYQATKAIFDFLKQGYSIGLFPEGDNTFYGETLDIYQSTGRLLKKANVDVILIKQQGGYISQPRWADYFAKNGVVHTHTEFLIKKEELESLTAEEINKKVETELYNNDYDFQREKMIPFIRKNRAEGIERLIYYCNKCGSVMSVFGKGDDIFCSKCGKIGHINEYEFIEGNKHDNLVDYNKEQYSNIEKVIKSDFVLLATLNIVDSKRLKNKKVGSFKIRYKNKTLTMKNRIKKIAFDITKIKHQVNTMRHSFSFDYEGITYNLTDIRNQFVLYEICRYINGSYKE